MSIRHVFIVFLALIAIMLSAPVPAGAQTYAGCSTSLKAYALSNPELHCTCPNGESGMPSCTRGGSGVSGAISTKAIVRQEIAGAVIQSFVNMLFSDNSQADAQKKMMMEELEKRKAEAELKKRIEEAKRLDAICRQLTATLKLSGLPSLKLKDSDSTSGLQLKLGEDTEGHVGVEGLPGIALNDTTGNGGDTAYGIQGLPGIYVNGPRSGTSAAQDGDKRLQLKTGEDIQTAAQTSQNATPPSLPATAVDGEAVTISESLANAMRDPQSMTPQQLADAAVLISSLPPEQQQRLLNPARNLSSHTTISAAPAATSTEDASTTGGGTANTQLQATAQTSQSAANAQTPEGMAEGAHAGFDTAASVALVSKPLATASSQPSAISAATTGSSTAAQEPASASTPVNAVASVASPMTPATVDLSKLDPDKPHTVTQLSTGTAGRAAGCPVTSTKILPTREELARELSGLRFKLTVLKTSLTRLNRSIQMDQQQFAEWQRETDDAVERSTERLKETIKDEIKDRFFNFAEEHYSNSPEKLKAVQNVDLLLAENGVYDWADKGKKDWEQVAEGLALLGANLPISKEAKDVLSASKSIIDSAFDISTEIAAWSRISQLQKNSDSYLAAVNKSGQQMKQIVTRIRDIEDSLATGNYAKGSNTVQPNMPVCE